MALDSRIREMEVWPLIHGAPWPMTGKPSGGVRPYAVVKALIVLMASTPDVLPDPRSLQPPSHELVRRVEQALEHRWPGFIAWAHGGTHTPQMMAWAFETASMLIVMGVEVADVQG